MDLLIKHGTWVVVPLGLALAFIYLLVYSKVYPLLVARSLDEEDRREMIRQGSSEAKPQKRAVDGSAATSRNRRTAESRP